MAIFVVVIFITITSHTYMDFEQPVAMTNVYLGSAGFEAAMAGNATPGYCTSAEYQYQYSAEWNYAADGKGTGAYLSLLPPPPPLVSSQLEHLTGR